MSCSRASGNTLKTCVMLQLPSEILNKAKFLHLKFRAFETFSVT